MTKLLSIPVGAALVATALLAGCGGNGGDGGAATPNPTAATPFMGTTVESLLAYMNRLIDNTSETSDPEPLDATPLPVDDTA